MTGQLDESGGAPHSQFALLACVGALLVFGVGSDCQGRETKRVQARTGEVDVFLDPDGGATTLRCNLHVAIDEGELAAPTTAVLSIMHWNPEPAAQMDDMPPTVRIRIEMLPFMDGGNGFGDPGPPPDGGVLLQASVDQVLGPYGSTRPGGGTDIELMRKCGGERSCTRDLNVMWSLRDVGGWVNGVPLKVIASLGFDVGDEAQLSHITASITLTAFDGGSSSPDGGP